MWVSKEKWDALVKRVEQLELNALKPKEPPTIRDGYRSRIWVWEPGPPVYNIEITHEALLFRILDHLGLKLEKVEGQQPYVKLAPKSPPPAKVKSSPR